MLTKLLSKTTEALFDQLSDLVGYAGAKELAITPRPGEHILPLRPYSQLDSFSCGAIAGASVLKYFHPRKKFEDFYSLVEPDREWGTSTRQLTGALRKSGVATKCCRLTYDRLLQAIGAGSPVLLCIRNPKAEYLHWVLAFGYGENHLVLSTNGIPYLNRKRIPKPKFLEMWKPMGNAIICSRAARRPTKRRRKARAGVK